MKSKLLYFLILSFIFIDCRVGNTQKMNYDCRLFQGDFDELEYVNGTLIEDSFTSFTHNINDGVFFINRFLGQHGFHKAILLKEVNSKLEIVDLLKDERRITLPEERQKRIKNLLNIVERGSFRQTCIEGPSEGSLSVLIVKTNGVIVFKYEAGHHDYSHLNDNEKIKIKNAFELINTMVSAVE
jgi:hypothetical protein